MDDPEERFTMLYDRYYRNVLGYVLLRVGQNVAEDVCSETFLVAWRRLDELPEQVLPWLLGVARNRLAKHREVRYRRTDLVERIAALTSEQEHVAWDVAEHVVDREQAVSALRALPEKDVEAMILATWYGLTPDQAATVMGCSPRAFNVRLHRARKRLTGRLHQEAGAARRPVRGTPGLFAEES
ncbi:sigma-70 family RNA polymerase sigma factor [Nonomuraea longispora]|uniref:Sigma-70 family RNA polymerase sigma factor n=1 Tax=Nonomuraea longispora TaxID=1848320 RepID=A0A4R4NFD6_9ACTN|nr:sigma-70 family RNA polymerase sigma factor [Nonomuraea longispora]TDC07134.1 sigma-70 family RNA polymerase sigma factor [Nonomuraea longispora]